MLRFECTSLIATFVLSICSATAEARQAADEIHPWDIYELELTAQQELSSPYVDGLPDGAPGFVTVTFRGEEGEAQGQQFKITGFWDGGRTWRVRFAPPMSGEWSYVSTSSDPGLEGQAGRFRCTNWTDADKEANATRRGFIQVCADGPRPGRYFQYADGTPMLWLGDTWWNWTKRGIPLERMQHLVDVRANQGFNIGQLFFAGRGWGRESSLLNRAFTQPDLEHIRNVERMIQYANQHGITVWVHPWWSNPDMQGSIGAENMRRWCRYMVHRLGAYI